jgi:hypothetical protein
MYAQWLFPSLNTTTFVFSEVCNNALNAERKYRNSRMKFIFSKRFVLAHWGDAKTAKYKGAGGDQYKPQICKSNPLASRILL